MENVLSAVSIEVIVLGAAEKGLHIALKDEQVIHVDLITADAIEVTDFIEGKVMLDGFWDEDVFVAETFQYIELKDTVMNA